VRMEVDELYLSEKWDSVMQTIDIFEIIRAQYLEKA